MSVYTTVGSPLGELLLVGEESAAARGGVALTSVSFLGVAGDMDGRTWGRREPEAFAEAERQVREYFDGVRREFELDFLTRGTEFQERVWAALDEIPYGETATYGAVAERIGAPRDRVRAVGAAIGANPLLILRACHRVIGAGGSLTGYAGGVERKRLLLTHEGALHPLFA
ncbi:methylated-DNA--[protein]-cysteine S-methyltransferase [Bailinhaonella thermotolerans]|uniref:methylated-DNA--[protein]-cysteine S-methyltransferase n=1 Tax=Bailinhaonella thermotolerans TaxID=1070861 RepID=A0A3A4B2J0_9ACTN|nr:methylated-DNA--[protein]-cysteine S-methyltransferase [Bailinhaonella thermotolerans]RJL34398.1 methylated-DNA--[protein]-cysteine S-methyltransferase [Bailinhaonella thermotolerans]